MPEELEDEKEQTVQPYVKKQKRRLYVNLLYNNEHIIIFYLYCARFHCETKNEPNLTVLCSILKVICVFAFEMYK